MAMNLKEFQAYVKKEEKKREQKELNRQRALKPNRHDRRKMVKVQEPIGFRGRMTTVECLVSAAELKRQKLGEYSKEDERILLYGC
jgi:hypothetical protein